MSCVEFEPTISSAALNQRVTPLTTDLPERLGIITFLTLFQHLNHIIIQSNKAVDLKWIVIVSERFRNKFASISQGKLPVNNKDTR